MKSAALKAALFGKNGLFLLVFECGAEAECALFAGGYDN